MFKTKQDTNILGLLHYLNQRFKSTSFFIIMMSFICTYNIYM